ncbi:MAG TPA: LapA family protein [Alphaproteobacteria bacterium]|nr:LapA family protein [Alphaproteobacteria bacterium]
MKLISGFLGLILAALALSFALANTQDTTISLWPFGISIQAPLYLLTLGTLLFGVLIGMIAGWVAMLQHRFEARRLRKEIMTLQEKITDLQQTVIPPARTGTTLRTSSKRSFWKMRA